MEVTRSESTSNDPSSKDESPESEKNFDYEPEAKKKRTGSPKNVNLLERLFPEQKSQVRTARKFGNIIVMKICYYNKQWLGVGAGVARM